MRDHRMRFGFVPLDVTRSCDGREQRSTALVSLRFLFYAARKLRTQTFQSMHPVEFCSAETGPKQEREKLPLAARASGLCSVTY